MDISKFINKNSSETVRINKFKRLSKGVSKKEKRRLETTLLTPVKLQHYTGENIRRVKFSKTSVKICFSSENHLELFKKYFKVHSFIESNVTNISLLMAFLYELDSGRLVYEKGKLSCCHKETDTKGISELGKGKQRFKRKK